MQALGKGKRKRKWVGWSRVLRRRFFVGVGGLLSGGKYCFSSCFEGMQKLHSHRAMVYILLALDTRPELRFKGSLLGGNETVQSWLSAQVIAT